jgi:hypothetical protein
MVGTVSSGWGVVTLTLWSAHDLFRMRLEAMIDARHELVRLAKLIGSGLKTPSGRFTRRTAAGRPCRPG